MISMIRVAVVERVMMVVTKVMRVRIRVAGAMMLMVQVMMVVVSDDREGSERAHIVSCRLNARKNARTNARTVVWNEQK